MASAYPGAFDTPPDTHQDNVGESVKATDINLMADAIRAIQATLGINPHQGALPTGTFPDVVSRLNALDVVSFKEITPPYTLVLGDMTQVLDCNNTVVAAITIPINTSVAFPVGASVTFRGTANVPASGVTFVGATGVTLRSLNSLVSMAGPYGFVTALKVATNIWNLVGNLA